jgi:DNA-binding NarL/FixJ family response regulator
MSIPVSIVEDDSAVRKLLAEWLALDGGFQCVSQHADAETALRLLPACHPALVLMDIQLPDLTGIECVRRLKRLIPETQFIMLTIYEDSDHIFEALAAGAIGYLLKQTEYSQLISSLKQVCEGGAPMSGHIARKVVQFFHETEPSAGRDWEGLSVRERQVLELLARGFLYKEITAALGISISTVNAHIGRIYEKLHVHSRTQAVAKFMQAQPSTIAGRFPFRANL